MRRIAVGSGLLAAVLTALSFAIAAQASAFQHVYVTDSSNPGNVGAAPVDEETGAVGTPLAPVATTGSPVGNVALAFTPTGSALFTNNGTSGALVGFPVTAGALGTPAPTASTAAFGLAVTPNGQFVYRGGTGGQITGFNLNASGTVTGPVPGSPFAVAAGPAGVAITPDGKYLYTANLGNSTVSAFSIGADGALTQLAGSPYATAANPYAISLTPDGEHLYVPGRSGAPHQIFAYDIGANGTLTATPGSPYNQTASVANSYGSTVTADGKYYFTANFGSSSISGWAIAANGSLTQIVGSPFSVASTGPSALMSDADASHLYMADTGSDNVLAFSLASNGVPTEITGSPFPIDASGDFQSVALTPNQAPKAALTSTVSGNVGTFDATGTTDDSAIATYAFDFGDGATMTTTDARPNHRYTEAGSYTVTVAATDDEGCSTTYTSAGQTAYCNGGPGATATTQVRIAAGSKDKPKLKVSFKKKQKLGKPITIKLEAQAGVRVSAANPKVKLKGGPEKKAFYKGGSKNIGDEGKAKLKLKITKKQARFAKAAKSGKVKVKLTAANNNGTEKKTVEIKLK